MSLRTNCHEVKILTVGADALIGPKPTDGTGKYNGHTFEKCVSRADVSIGPYVEMVDSS